MMELEALLGLGLPALVGYVVDRSWPTGVKVAVALVSSVVVGTVSAAISGDLSSAGDWAGAVGTVFAASQIAFHTFWRPTKIGDWIEARGSWVADLLNRLTGGRLDYSDDRE